MKLWSTPCRTTEDGHVMVERSNKTWFTGKGNDQALQYSCLENTMNSMKRQKDRTLKDELPRPVGAHWGGWMASPTPWTWVWASSRSWWWTRKPGVLQFMGSQRDMTELLNWTGLYNPWNSPGQNTGVGSCSLLQGIFPTQGSNPGLLHCRQMLYPLNHHYWRRVENLLQKEWRDRSKAKIVPSCWCDWWWK